MCAAHRLHTRNRAKFWDEPSVKATLHILFAVFYSRNHLVEHEETRRFEPGTRRAQIEEAFDEQSGPCEQQQRERQLRDDESGAHARAVHSADRAFRSLLKRFVYIASRQLQRWQQTEQERTENRQRDRERTNTCVDTYIIEPRKIARTKRAKDVNAP